MEILESNEAESQFYEKISRMLDGKHAIVLLDRNGEQFDTQGVTKLVTSFSENGINRLFFVVGGASGFPKQIIPKAKKILALSKMVFPHKIARLVLVEQLYRVKCIINRHPYHKG